MAREPKEEQDYEEIFDDEYTRIGHPTFEEESWRPVAEFWWGKDYDKPRREESSRRSSGFDNYIPRMNSGF